MGYLQIPTSTLPNLSQAVISLWFRVPAASISACNAAFVGSTTSLSSTSGIIPLLCIGSAGTAFETTTPTTPTTACNTFFHPADPGPVFTETDLGFIPHKENVGTMVTGAADRSLPTLIGLDCSGLIATLFINLQTNTNATIARASYDFTSLTAANTYTGVSGGGYPPGPNTDAIYVYTDSSAVFYNATETFTGSSEINVTADVWHHILLSFDLQTVETEGNFPGSVSDNTVSASRMWLGFDDVNKTQLDLSEFWPDGSSDDNAILTASGYDVAGLSPNPGGTGSRSSTSPTDYGIFSFNRIPAGTPSYILTDPTIAAAGLPMGLPADARFVSSIYKVEQAELQIFAGVTLNTGIEDNRRAFITDEGSPANMSLAQTLLGQAPDIKLHGSNNWIIGANTGSLGTTLEPTGIITAFTPNP